MIYSSLSFNELVGSRVKIAREELDISQEELAKKLHFPSRQILSNIETGTRSVSIDEMNQFTKLLKKPLDFFTDPYLIVDDTLISYRAQVDTPQLSEFEKKVNNLISAVIRFFDLSGRKINPFKRQLPIQQSCSLTAASTLGSQVAQTLELTPIPSEKLESYIEEELGIHVIKVDAPEGISGAACHLPFIDVIIINRKEPLFRQHFDLAHELFHVLTWTQLPPKQHDWTTEQSKGKKSKIEKLADAFASGLLMPEQSMRVRWEARNPKDNLHQWILQQAEEMDVSGQAFYWRLVNLRLISPKLQKEIDRNKLTRKVHTREPSLLFNKHFVQSMHTVLDQGKVSARKAASLVDLDVEELAPLFASYGLTAPF